MVMEPSGLIESDDEQHIFPLWPTTNSIIDLLEENLTICNEARGVH
jgi:hypothetical protein